MVFSLAITAVTPTMAESGGIGAPTSDQVTDLAQVNAVTADFQRSMETFGVTGQLSDCRMMVKILPVMGRGTSYGAICNVNNAKHLRPILICDDTMVGKFTIKAWGFAETLDQVKYFTTANCPPGG